jgi:hypothetical protein
MKITFLTIMLTLLLTGCQKKEITEDAGKNLYQTWILIEKNINGIKEALPSDDTYPVTLTLDSAKTFHGRHDANIYAGTYKLNKDTISFSYSSITDITDIDWYLSYISELAEIEKIMFVGTNNIKLSNKTDSVILHFTSKELFEKSYFKLEEWYNF